MDKVIFNGEVTAEELKEERGDQWARYQKEGNLEQFAVDKPSSVAWELAFRIFGFVAVLTGLILAVVMFYTFISHLG